MEDKTPRPGARPIALIAVVVAAGLLFAPTSVARLGVWRDRLLDFGHVPLFAALLLALRAGFGPPLRGPLLVTIGLAALAEIVQPCLGRSGGWIDFLRGALGALAAAAAVRAWELRRSRYRAVARAVLAAALLVWPVVEAAPYLADTVEGRRTFPVLADFSADREMLRWECDQAAVTREHGGGRLEFFPGPGAFSSAALRPVVADFSGYRWLCYEFRVTGAPLDLVTSLRTGTSASDRTTHTDVARTCAVGTHVARVDLAAMAARGRPEPLDLADVRSVILFVVRTREPRDIALTRIWLEP